MTDLTPGETIYCIGLDMQCRKVVTKEHFVGTHTDGRPIIRGFDGISVIYAWKDIYKTAGDARKAIESES